MEIEGDNELINIFEEYGIILRSEKGYKLKSGKLSNIYFDIRKIFGYPDIFIGVINKLKDLLDDIDYDIICGVPIGALPLAVGLSMSLLKPFIVIRDKEKAYGTKKIIEGIYNKGDNCILIEDTITTGTSVINVKKQLESFGINVVCIISIVYRGNNFFNNDYKYLIKLKENNNILNEKIKTYNSKLIISIDLDNYNDVLNIIKQITSECIIIKLHLDLIKDIDKISFKQIIKERNIWIMEDRKFADIGYITKKQLKNAWWKSDVRFITVHSIAGETTIQGLIEIIIEDNLNLFLILIIEMSTDSLIDDEYMINSVKLANKYNEYIIGVIAQHRPYGLNKDILVMTPGISLENNMKDKLGQKYKSIKEAKEKGSDIIIVGRGITESNDILSSLTKYRIESFREI